MNQGTPEERRPLSCPRARVLLEVFLDGELAGRRLARFESHVDTCAACRMELQEALRIQRGLAELPSGECPGKVTRQVLAWATAHEAGTSRTLPLSDWLRRWEAVWRPVLAGLGVAISALLIALAAREPARSPRRGAPTPVRAELEARWALAYVARMTRQSSDQALGDVMDEVVGQVIGGNVVAPITQAVRRPLQEDGS